MLGLSLLCVHAVGWTPSSGWELGRRNCAKRTCIECLATANQKHYMKNFKSESMILTITSVFPYVYTSHPHPHPHVLYPPFPSSPLHPPSFLMLCPPCLLLTHALMLYVHACLCPHMCGGRHWQEQLSKRYTGGRPRLWVAVVKVLWLRMVGHAMLAVVEVLICALCLSVVWVGGCVCVWCVCVQYSC